MWALLLLAATGVAALAWWALSLRGHSGDRTLTGPPSDPFHLRYTHDWQKLSPGQLRALSNVPLAMLRQNNGKGVIVIRRDKRAVSLDKRFASELDRQLRARLPDYRLISARIVSTRAGGAFYFAYVRLRRGTLHTVLIVPAGDHSYVLDTVSNPGAGDVSKEIGKIIGSFSPT